MTEDDVRRFEREFGHELRVPRRGMFLLIAMILLAPVGA
jgi:hypothetical protein